MSTTDTSTVLVGHVVDDELTLTLDELCGVCAVRREQIVELVECGVLAQPMSDDAITLGATALRRARLALRLQRDLGVNAAGAALAVELLERIRQLETRLGGG